MAKKPRTILFGAIGGILLPVGSLIGLWGLFCFIGGPDGEAFSLESILIGFGFCEFGAVLIAVGVFLVKMISKTAFES